MYDYRRNMHPSTSEPPGWYDDAGMARWWDGRRWTGRTRDLEPEPEPVVAATDDGGRWTPGIFIVAGIVGVLFFGVPGLTRSFGNQLVDIVFTIGGAIAVIWIAIGVIGIGVRAGRRD